MPLNKVRAKFIVKSVESFEDYTNINLTPVTTGSEENKAFYKWTPSGNITLGCVNPAVVETMKPGKVFYVDFTEEVNDAQS